MPEPLTLLVAVTAVGRHGGVRTTDGRIAGAQARVAAATANNEAHVEWITSFEDAPALGDSFTVTITAEEPRT